MAFSCFLKITGTHQGWIKGESAIDGYKEWIEVDSFNLGAVNSISHAFSTSGQISTGRSDARPVTVRKKLDLASMPCLTAIWTNEHIKQFDIHVCRQTKEHELVLKIESKKGLISKYDADASTSGPELTESLTFVAAEIEVTYTQFDSKGKKLGNNMAAWSFAENR